VPAQVAGRVPGRAKTNWEKEHFQSVIFFNQVLRNRIHHVRSSAPSGSEVFYEVTGKEPAPRPLGEDHGAVIFDYVPGNNTINYFRLDAKLLLVKIIYITCVNSSRCGAHHDSYILIGLLHSGFERGVGRQ
jgi:hypothetical protein